MYYNNHGQSTKEGYAIIMYRKMSAGLRQTEREDGYYDYSIASGEILVQPREIPSNFFFLYKGIYNQRKLQNYRKGCDSNGVCSISISTVHFGK